MRQFLILLVILINSICIQAQNSAKSNRAKARFEAKIDIAHATKDGIYLNGYVVNIPYPKLTELNGKTVRIKGKVTIVKGTKHFNDGEAIQGRNEDTKHILKPKIRVLTN